MNWKRHFHKNFTAAVLASGLVFVVVIFWTLLPTRWSDVVEALPAEVASPESKRPLHLPTPVPVKAIYMTSWVAGTPKWRAELVEFVKKSEINGIVIDVKDYSGHIAFDTEDEVINSLGSEEIRAADLKEFIELLHGEGIYTIARITVFQDPIYSKKHPELSVQKKSKPGALWKDRKGLSYVDPAAREFWDYTVRVAMAAEKIGFDELNFDYIRYPSDGNMSDIKFPISALTIRDRQFVDDPGSSWKTKILSEFFAYLDSQLSDLPVPISADVFGMTTTNYDDLNVGQVLEAVEPHFDYIAPMVYPSHYPTGFRGYKNPAAKPYEIVLYSMSRAVERLNNASSTPAKEQPPLNPPPRGGEKDPPLGGARGGKLRPWLQDFDLGATYDAAKVRAQIQATYDSGLDSWMIWDPANKYTREAYYPQ